MTKFERDTLRNHYAKGIELIEAIETAERRLALHEETLASAIRNQIWPTGDLQRQVDAKKNLIERLNEKLNKHMYPVKNLTLISN